MKKCAFIFIIYLCIIGCATIHKDNSNKNIDYKPTWESLSEYNEAPEWFKDAKFGIFAHWGVLSVPAYANDWYARNMHIIGGYEYNHHVATYGDISKFGYHDFVPMFKAEKFNAETWADLYAKSGAKFAGIVAEHHDGWSNWASKVNPWNSLDMGPHRDLLGELNTAIRAKGLKLVTTFHKERNLQMFKDDPTMWMNDDSYFPYNPKLATSSTDPLLSIMYGNIPKEQFYENWYGELKELVDNYSPDLIYFDGLMKKIPESYKKKFIAYYFNKALANNKEVVISNKGGDLPKSISIEDLEKGRTDNITKDYWLTDETIAVWSWSYTDVLEIRPANEILDLLIDIVSKNGIMLLNISPKADGTIPYNQQKVLLNIGQWLKINGESIYGTRSWLVFGEGPSKQLKSGAFQTRALFTEKDIRYTKKENTIYAIVLGWPGNNKYITLSSFTKKILENNVPEVTKLSVLGTDEKIIFRQDILGLHIRTPSKKIDDKAFVIKIDIK